MPDSVPCPKCKGGCDLCSGKGEVTSSVARLYIREEARPTVKMRPHERAHFLAEEVPTQPALIKRARRRQRIGIAILIGICAALLLAGALLWRP